MPAIPKTRVYTRVISLICALACPFPATAESQSTGQNSTAGGDDLSQLSINEIGRRLDNPLTSLWSLTFQTNYARLKGDAIEGDRYSATSFFQPALPIPVGENHDKIFIARPVFPIVKKPLLDPTQADGTDGHISGFGDVQMMAVIGPNRLDGVVWGLGGTFKFPTASEDELGQEKWQVGPAAMLFNFTRTWSMGVMAQHWTSVAGDDDRADTNQTDIQYVIRRAMGNGWSLGMGPTITIDWEADSGDKVTFPIGLGITKTLRIGKTPWKMRFEPQYSIIKPDNLGADWNIRIQFAPVIKSPFSSGL
jgi:hypothetical protein